MTRYAWVKFGGRWVVGRRTDDRWLTTEDATYVKPDEIGPDIPQYNPPLAPGTYWVEHTPVISALYWSGQEWFDSCGRVIPTPDKIGPRVEKPEKI